MIWPLGRKRHPFAVVEEGDGESLVFPTLKFGAFETLQRELSKSGVVRRKTVQRDFGRAELIFTYDGDEFSFYWDDWGGTVLTPLSGNHVAKVSQRLAQSRRFVLKSV
ncbi:MAG TPA: hypothetical protein VF138_11935 [Caulobacteraceae bacterium]